MNANGKANGSVDLALFHENWRKIPWEALEPYAGQWIAISGDGTQVLAGGLDLETAEARLAQLGIAGNTVVWERIPSLNEETWL